MPCLVAASSWLVQLAEYLLSKSDGCVAQHLRFCGSSLCCSSHCCTRDKIITITVQRLERMSTRLQEMRRAVSD